MINKNETRHWIEDENRCRFIRDGRYINVLINDKWLTSTFYLSRQKESQKMVIKTHEIMRFFYPLVEKCV